MAVFSGMFPILPGKEDAARAWIAEASGRRRDGGTRCSARPS